MRKFLKNEHADIKMIGMVIGLLVTLLIAIMVIYNIAGSLDPEALDAKSFGRTSTGGTTAGNEQMNQTPAGNSTTPILDQSATFFTIAPIIAIVVVAVVILSYVGKI